MKVRIVLLGLVLLNIAFAATTCVTPVLDSLPQYSKANYTLRWTWDNSTICCDLQAANLCTCFLCFQSYEIQERGASLADYTVEYNGIKHLNIENRPEGKIEYRIMVKYISDAGPNCVSGWSAKVSTTVDNSIPYVNAYSDKSSYVYGEKVIIGGYATDSISGVNYTYVYLDGKLVNSSQGSYVIYSSQDLGLGTHTYFANATDNVGWNGRSQNGSFEVIAAPSTIPADTTPPNVSISSNKYTYSNNETIYLHVLANDSAGLSVTQVIVNDVIRCTNSTPGLEHRFTCAVGPFAEVSNGTTGIYYYKVRANDTSNNINETTPASFTVVGNSSCNDLNSPLYNLQCGNNGTQSFLCRCYSKGCAISLNCTGCACPGSLLCDQGTQACYAPANTCPDGTAYGQCSITLPKYCANGIIVDNCTKCGCPAGMGCSATNNSCYSTAYAFLCGNGLCEAGESATCCRDCGCSDGRLCNRTTDICYLPPGPAVYIGLSLISPKQTNIFLSPGQSVRFVLELKDENKRLVNNATVNVYPTTEKYSSSFMGDGQYEVTYQARTNTTAYFQEYTINLRAKRYLNSQEQFSQTISLSITLDKFLDIDFITPQQNQSITGSQPVEVKIKYPDGSPVLVGSFGMIFGNETIPLALSGEAYRTFLNLTDESYGAKNITFIGRDNYDNTLNKILVVYYTYRIDYTVYFVALLLIAGGSSAGYFVYKWGKDLSKDYKTLKKEKVYLETMDKRTHLEFFKRHIDENTFKKLVLEYQQKSTDVDRIITEMERRHRWLKWV